MSKLPNGHGGAAATYCGVMLILAAIVLCATVAMFLANRHNRTSGHLAPNAMDELTLIDISDYGLLCHPRSNPPIDDADHLVHWVSVVEVAVINRRELFRNWFGFEIAIDGRRLVVIDGRSPDAEAFLGQVHNLPGFDHSGLLDALRERRPRAVCYSS